MSKINDTVTRIKAKPNKVTFRIVALGGAAVAALWFGFTDPARSSFADAVAEREEAQQRYDRLTREIDSFRSGASYTAPEIGPAVAPVEDLLPEGGSPGATANRIRDLATGSGLSVGSVSFPNAYTQDGPDKLRADVKIDVSGPVSGVTSWLDALTEFDQLITVDTSGPSFSDDGTANLSVTATVWATTLEGWRDGLPQDAAKPSN